MKQPNQYFRRSSLNLPYRKNFVIAVEGQKTEVEYFDIFKKAHPLMINIKCLSSKSDSNPLHVLERMKRYLAKNELKKTDEAWLVVDRDCWTEEQLQEPCKWARTHDNCYFAISNPKFEYWLLLHFEDGNAISSAADCDNRLKKHIPNYNKSIRSNMFTIDRIKDAVRRARLRDTSPHEDWPHTIGTTTVYRLVEKILATKP